MFEKVKRWQFRLFEVKFAESWILLAQSILRPWNSSYGTCFTRWSCFYFKVWQTGGILLMMPYFDLVDWKCKSKSVRFYIIFNREKKCLGHVAMVAKFPELNKQWSCKYGREKNWHYCMTLLYMITLRNKTVAHTFLPSFNNANGRLCQERLLRSRNLATHGTTHSNVTSHYPSLLALLSWLTQ